MRKPAYCLTATCFVGAMLSACAGLDAPATLTTARSGPAAESPQFRVGDRWVYRVSDGFRVKQIFEETHAVTAIGPDGIAVQVTITGPGPTVERVEKWLDAGRVTQGTLFDIETRRFHQPLERYRFPLQAGTTWNQFVDNYNELTMREGRINRYVRVGGYERVTTPAGTFDAIRLNVLMRLDDDEFWRWPTDCAYTVWYAPAVKATIREVKRADYLERGTGPDSGARLPSQNALVELVSFTPGA
jgi:hypothetical protein